MTRWWLGPVFGGVLVVLAGGLATWWQESRKPESVHFHAAFQVYVDGQQVDFSADRYMQVEPCGEEHQPTPEEQQLEKAHLHDRVGDVVHVHQPGSTWADLFRNLGYGLAGPVSAYRGDQAVADILHQAILPDERVLIVQGPLEDRESKIAALPTVERLREVEQASETCGS